MRTLTTIVGFSAVIAAAASLVLAICWLLSLALVWLLGFTSFQSFALAMGSVAILTVFGLVVVTQKAWEFPWLVGPGADDADEFEALEPELKDAGSEGEGNWFRPCPCGSEKAFARCCGKRAFKKKRA